MHLRNKRYLEFQFNVFYYLTEKNVFFYFEVQSNMCTTRPISVQGRI